MSYREEMKEKVEAIVAKGHDVNNKIVEMVKNDFKQTIDDCRKSGTSLKSATYEILDGIEEGLKSSTYDTKKILKESSDAMVDVVKESANASIAKANKLLEDAQTKLHESTDNAKDAAKDKVDAAYETLHQKTEKEKEHLQDIADGMKEYSKEKAHGMLDSSIQKTNEAITDVENSFKSHSRNFLDNVEQKTSSFNHALIAKIKKYL